MPTERRTGAGNRPALTQRQSVDFEKGRHFNNRLCRMKPVRGKVGAAMPLSWCTGAWGMETTCMISPFDGQWPTGVRILAVVAWLVAGGFAFMTTAKGAQTREFLSESRFELRKVVWPTRQETTRTMWVVIAVVILMSLMLAGMDLVIQAAVKWLLGNG